MNSHDSLKVAMNGFSSLSLLPAFCFEAEERSLAEGCLEEKSFDVDECTTTITRLSFGVD